MTKLRAAINYYDVFEHEKLIAHHPETIRGLEVPFPMNSRKGPFLTNVLVTIHSPTIVDIRTLSVVLEVFIGKESATDCHRGT